jgi:hypothetical protein
MKIKVQPKKSRIPMTEEELRVYYEQVKGSGRVSRVEKKYHRPRDKKVKSGDTE